MKQLPRPSDKKRSQARITIRGITFVQAYNRSPDDTRSYAPTLALAWSQDGEAIFALPGGGRATLLELRKQFEAA